MNVRNFIVSALAISFLIACDNEKDLYKPESKKTVSDLIIPQDFDWKLTRPVSVDLKSSQATSFAIYQDKSCQYESLLLTGTVFPSGATDSYNLELPKHMDVVYLKYNDKITPLNIVDNTLSAVLEGNGTRTAGSQEEVLDVGVQPYPCPGYMATIMFEDLFPSEGDYDFNDFVINYKSLIRYDTRTNNMIDMTLHMRINALGGLLPYTPCFRLENIQSDQISRISVVPSKVQLGDFEDPDLDMCFSINNLGYRPENCQYLNTDPNKTIIPKSQLDTVTIAFEFSQENPIRLVDFGKLNIFILSGTLEVHEKGKKPTRTIYPEFPDAGDDYYCNDKNLVWAFTVPAEIKHTIEKANFLLAYPSFAAWAESGGAPEFDDWYTHTNQDYLITLPEN